MKQIVFSCILGAASVSLFATSIPQHASVRGGGGGSGKCTIEVEVENSATVEITGSEAILNSRRDGANWKRFECNQVLPRHPRNFRFHGVDGRGRQELAQPPEGNGGTAVVRIEDNGSGREGYTFDIEWDGGDDRGAYSYDRDRGAYPSDRRYSDGDAAYPAERSVDMCKAYVSDEARGRYGLREVNFDRVGFDQNQRRRDWITGTFRSDRGDDYHFTCSIDLDNGRVRSADIQRSR